MDNLAPRFLDIGRPEAPLAKVERIRLEDESKCELSGATLHAGEDAIRFTLFALDPSAETGLLARPDAFERTHGENYRERFKKDQYRPADFKHFEGFDHPAHRQLLGEFGYERARELLVTPQTRPSQYAYSVEEAAPFDPERNPGELIALLTIVLKCGFADRLVEETPHYPTRFCFLLALLDDDRFAKVCAHRLGGSDLYTLLDILRRPQLQADGHRFMKTYFQRHPEVQTPVRRALETYELHHAYTLAQASEKFHRLWPLRNVRLVHLFTEHSAELPLLDRFLRDDEFPSWGRESFTYTECYYRRLRLLHKVDHGSASEVRTEMRSLRRVAYYHAGDPQPFIDDALRLVETYRKTRA